MGSACKLLVIGAVKALYFSQPGIRYVGQFVLVADRGAEVGDGVEGNEASVLDDADAVTERLRLLHVMRGEKDGRTLLPVAAEERPKIAAGLRVEAGGGLVQHE